MGKSSYRILILFLTINFFSCVRTQLTQLTQEQYPEVDPDDVMIYFSPEEIKSDYEKLGIIHAQGEGSWTNEHQMLETVRKKAGRIGANGVIWGNIKEPSSGAKIAGTLFGISTTRRGQFVAIYVYQDDYSNDFTNPPRSFSQKNDPAKLQHVDFQSDGTKLERTDHSTSNTTETPKSEQQKRLSSDAAKVANEEKVDDQKETTATRLFYFRKVVESATKFTDEQILKFYRKKYPSLKSKTDDDLIMLIEKKYIEIFENKN